MFITHDLGVVAELCDRVSVMYAALSSFPRGTPIGDQVFAMAAWAAFALAVAPVMCGPFYRYRYVFRLKADHPDWTALQCMRGCSELTYGFKWRSFKLDCSYWRTLLLVVLPVLLGTAVLVAVESAMDGRAI